MIKKGLLTTVILLSSICANAQDTLQVDTFQFVIQKQNKITTVKNQASSGTCRSFSALGFFEAELRNVVCQRIICFA